MDPYATYDVPMSHLPEHLRYREPRVANSFAGVESRYRRPSPTRRPEYNPPKQDRAGTPNPRFAGVASRFRSPQKVQEGPKPEVLSRQESVKQTDDYRHHKRVAAAAGFGHTEARYKDHLCVPATTAATPRDRVQEKIQDLGQKKNGVAFKAWSTQAKTFSDMAKENSQMRRWDSPSARSRGKTSVVMDWVDRGVPIPTTRSPSPVKRPAPAPQLGARPYAGGGGAGGGSFNRRPSSPTKQVVKMEAQKIRTMSESMKAARIASPPRAAASTTAAVTSKYSRPASPASRRSPTPRASPDRRPASPTRVPKSGTQLNFGTPVPKQTPAPRDRRPSGASQASVRGDAEADSPSDASIQFSVPPRDSEPSAQTQPSVLVFRRRVV